MKNILTIFDNERFSLLRNILEEKHGPTIQKRIIVPDGHQKYFSSKMNFSYQLFEQFISIKKFSPFLNCFVFLLYSSFLEDYLNAFVGHLVESEESDVILVFFQSEYMYQKKLEILFQSHVTSHYQIFIKNELKEWNDSIAFIPLWGSQKRDFWQDIFLHRYDNPLWHLEDYLLFSQKSVHQNWFFLLSYEQFSEEWTRQFLGLFPEIRASVFILLPMTHLYAMRRKWRKILLGFIYQFWMRLRDFFAWKIFVIKN